MKGIVLYITLTDKKELTALYATRVCNQTLFAFGAGAAMFKNWLAPRIREAMEENSDVNVSGLAVMYFSIGTKDTKKVWKLDVARTYSLLVRGSMVRRLRGMRKALQEANGNLPHIHAAQWLEAMGDTTSTRSIVDSIFDRLETNPFATYIEAPGRPCKRSRFTEQDEVQPQGNASRDWVNTHFSLVRAARSLFREGQNKTRNQSRLKLFNSLTWLVRHIEEEREKGRQHQGCSISFPEALPEPCLTELSEVNGDREEMDALLDVSYAWVPNSRQSVTACKAENTRILNELTQKFPFFNVDLKYRATVVVTDRERSNDPSAATAPTFYDMVERVSLLRVMAVAYAAMMQWDINTLYSTNAMTFRVIFVLALGLRGTLREALPDMLGEPSEVEQLAMGEATLLKVEEGKLTPSLMHNRDERKKRGGNTIEAADGSSASSSSAKDNYRSIIRNKLQLSLQQYLRLVARSANTTAPQAVSAGNVLPGRARVNYDDLSEDELTRGPLYESDGELRNDE